MILSKKINTYVVTVICLFLLSCSENVEKIPTPKGFALDLYEVRILGEGIAPDSLKVYLVSPGEDITQKDYPVFEGQDIGSICYAWPNLNELEISISGGFVDNVETQWEQSNGHIVKIKYVENINCSWKYESQK